MNFMNKKNIITNEDVLMAKRYIQYLLNNAYIPLQDLLKYEKAYKRYCDFNNIKFKKL